MGWRAPPRGRESHRLPQSAGIGGVMADKKFESLMPTDVLMAGAWCAALTAAMGSREIIAAFRAETGMAWTPARSGVDRMIDEATGFERHFVLSFVRWFNANVWGETDGRASNGDEQDE